MPFGIAPRERGSTELLTPYRRYPLKRVHPTIPINYIRTRKILRDDLVDDAVFLGFLGSHVEIAVDVVHDLIRGLAGVLCQGRRIEVLQSKELFGGNFNVRGLSSRFSQRLVNMD